MDSLNLTCLDAHQNLVGLKADQAAGLGILRLHRGRTEFPLWHHRGLVSRTDRLIGFFHWRCHFLPSGQRDAQTDGTTGSAPETDAGEMRRKLGDGSPLYSASFVKRHRLPVVPQECAKRIAKVSADAKLEVDEETYLSQFKPHLMDVVYAWANGATFAQICKMTDVFEGPSTVPLRRWRLAMTSLSSSTGTKPPGRLEEFGFQTVQLWFPKQFLEGQLTPNLIKPHH